MGSDKRLIARPFAYTDRKSPDMLTKSTKLFEHMFEIVTGLEYVWIQLWAALAAVATDSDADNTHVELTYFYEEIVTYHIHVINSSILFYQK